MGLMAMFEEILNDQVATVITAIGATEQTGIAKIAPIAVASRPDRNKADRYLHLIQDKGVPDDDATVLVRKLVGRDAQLDDRKSCVECRNFTPYGCRISKHPIGQTTMYTLHRAPCFDAAHSCAADHA